MRLKDYSSVSYEMKSCALMYKRVVSLMNCGDIMWVNFIYEDNYGLKNTFFLTYWSSEMNYSICY